jgi:hypothetical protein
MGNLARNAINWVKGNGQFHLAGLAKRFKGETPQDFTIRANKACKALFDSWISTLLIDE